MIGAEGKERIWSAIRRWEADLFIYTHARSVRAITIMEGLWVRIMKIH